MKLTGFNGQTIYCDVEEIKAIGLSAHSEQAEVWLAGCPVLAITKAQALQIIDERKWA